MTAEVTRITFNELMKQYRWRAEVWTEPLSEGRKFLARLTEILLTSAFDW